MTQLQFAQPQWLWAGALCCAAMWGLFVRAGRLRRRATAGLAGTRFVTTASRARRVAKQALLLAGIAAAFATLARPLWGFRWEQETREGVDLMFAVDTSKSMGATDLRPDRLTRAKLAVKDLLREFPGERVGLIAFAGEAFVQAPMTIDHAVFGEALDALDTSVIPRGGTDIASALRAAVRAMATEPGRRKVLVLLSDGEDLQGETAAASEEAARAGVVVYAVGVGTPAGELIPVERDGGREVMRDADGQPVRSRLDEGTLRRLAEKTGGSYAALGPSGRGLELLYRQHLSRLPTRTVEERMHKVYTERFQIPLGIAIACLLVELAIGERAQRRSSRRPVSVVAGTAAALLLMTGLNRDASASAPASAPSPSVAPSGGGVASYNEGTTAYRRKDFVAARDRFLGATHTTDVGMQSDAYYDLGNARFRLGQASLSKDKQATMEAWKEAIASYDGALALRKEDADARFNRDLVARRLAALEEQERQKKQNQPAPKDQPPKAGSSKSAPSSAGQGQKDQSQGGKGQSQQSQGSARGGPGDPQSSSKAPRDGAENQPGKQDQQPGQGQSAAQGPQGGGSASPTGKEGKKSAEGRPDQPSTAQQAGTPADQEPGSAPGAEAKEEPGAPPQGPGVVSGPDQPRGDDRASASARPAPGALSRGEAMQLLDSVSGELRRLPVAAGNRRAHHDDESPTKDW